MGLVFCFLPADQRYYLVTMPLLFLTVLRGLIRMPRPFRLGVYLFVLLLSVSIPGGNRQSQRSGAADQSGSVSATAISTRSAERCRAISCALAAAFFNPMHRNLQCSTTSHPSHMPPQRLAKASAIYTDEAWLGFFPGWQLNLVAEFSRSVVIYGKHHDVRLFRVEKRNTP